MKELIICPQCSSIELAEVDTTTIPWNTYIHHCSKCGYTIMESEWDKAKAVSIKQPWASLIVEGIKDIENRTWKTNYRGRVLIHSALSYAYSKSTLPSSIFSKDQWNSIPIIQQRDIIRGRQDIGAIIGSVEIIDCVVNHPSIWAEKTNTVYQLAPEETSEDYPKPIYNWVLANPIKFPEPILNVKGRLSFFIPAIP